MPGPTDPPSKPLVLLRHGQSTWNLQNRFTGWTDVDLTETGRAEALHAADILARHALDFDICYTSVLKRAIRTAWIVLDRLDRMWLPIIPDWRLNERHYGALQGLDKAETAEKFGAPQVAAWRRSFAQRPPPLPANDPRNPTNDPRYAALDPTLLPTTESLQDTAARTLPYWQTTIAPNLRQGRRVLIVAHGNSLRALVKQFDAISNTDVEHLDIATGHPIAYSLDAACNPVGREELK